MSEFTWGPLLIQISQWSKQYKILSFELYEVHGRNFEEAKLKIFNNF